MKALCLKNKTIKTTLDLHPSISKPTLQFAKPKYFLNK